MDQILLSRNLSPSGFLSLICLLLQVPLALSLSPPRSPGQTPPPHSHGPKYSGLSSPLPAGLPVSQVLHRLPSGCALMLSTPPEEFPKTQIELRPYSLQTLAEVKPPSLALKLGFRAWPQVHGVWNKHPGWEGRVSRASLKMEGHPPALPSLPLSGPQTSQSFPSDALPELYFGSPSVRMRKPQNNTSNSAILLEFFLVQVSIHTPSYSCPNQCRPPAITTVSQPADPMPLSKEKQWWGYKLSEINTWLLIFLC